MWAYIKAVLFTLIVIGSIRMLPRDIKAYKAMRNKLTLLGIIGQILMIPCGVILFINCFVSS